MPDTHECPRPGCSTQVRNDFLACRPHWFELPREIRQRIWLHWTSGKTAKHAEAVADAEEFWQAKVVAEHG